MFCYMKELNLFSRNAGTAFPTRVSSVLCAIVAERFLFGSLVGHAVPPSPLGLRRGNAVRLDEAAGVGGPACREISANVQLITEFSNEKI